MKNFDNVIGDVLKNEGGYVDHPSDPGGATNMGITRRTLADWRGIVPYTKLPKQAVKDLTVDEAKKIYKAKYWDAVKGDLLPSGLDYAVFDYGLHSGPAKAVKELQSLVGASVDGVVGNETLSAVAARVIALEADGHSLATLVNAYMNERMKFLQGLATFGVFGRGWEKRIKNVRAKAISMAEANKVQDQGNDNKAPDQPATQDNSQSEVNKWVRILVVLGGIVMSLWRLLRRS